MDMTDGRDGCDKHDRRDVWTCQMDVTDRRDGRNRRDVIDGRM